MIDPLSDIDDDSVTPDLFDRGADSRLEIHLGPDTPTERLDRVLAGIWPEVSRARLQTLIEQGHLTLDGHRISDGKHKARPGTYVLTLPPPIEAIPQAQALQLEVIYEDAHLIVINKAAGMAAHPGPGTPDGTLVNALLAHCGESLSGIGGVVRPGIVHRLDKDTSGLMVAAKTDAAHKGLSDLFSRHDIDREYIALTRGVPKGGKGTLTTRIGRSPHDRQKMAVLKAGGREAITHFETLEIFGPKDKPVAALVRCRLETGRTHQIRVHMAHLGAPCLGDGIYGSGSPTKIVLDAIAESGLQRQALHARLLGFVHPVTGEKLRFEHDPPKDMAALRDLLAISC